MSDECDLQAREDEEMRRIAAGWEADYAKTLPIRFQEATFDTFDPFTDALARAVGEVGVWAQEPHGGLFVYGPVGTGKTHLAIAASRALVRRSRRARFVSTTDYLERKKRSFDGKTDCMEPRDLSKWVDVLVLDDLGAERPTEWAREQMFGIIDGAYGADVLLVATSNHTYGELAAPEMLDERCVSRLVEMTNKVLVDGADYRAAKHRGRQA